MNTAGNHKWMILGAVLLALALVLPMAGAMPVAAAGGTGTVKVLDSSGDPLPGATVWSWNPSQRTYTTDASGLATVPAPGSVQVQVNFTRGEVKAIAIGETLVFQTGCLDMPGRTWVDIYAEPNPFIKRLNLPAELMPGTHTLFKPVNFVEFDITAGKCLRGVLLRLVDSTGKGLAGGFAKYYYGNWLGYIAGVTNANGYLLANVPVPSNPNTPVKGIQMYYKCGTTRAQYKDNATMAADGNTWRTLTTTVVAVKKSDTSIRVADAEVAGYFPMWMAMGKTDGNGELLLQLLGGSNYTGTVNQYTLNAKKGLYSSTYATQLPGTTFTLEVPIP
jgi:hypothetical protein